MTPTAAALLAEPVETRLAARGESPARTEGGDAPAGLGATSEHIGPYLSEEQRRPAGCSAGRMPADFHHGLLGASHDDTGLWRRDHHLAPVADLLPRIKVLSLDIFDTLIFRTCQQPEDVFLEVGRRAVAAGLLGRGLAAGEFADLRRTAQQTAYATLGREPRLEDIYAGLPAAIGPLGTLLQLEEAAEGDFCILNPSVASLVAHCNEVGIPVVLLSDMYLGERRVRALLARAGFDTDGRTDRVIVSVDAGGYKMTGALYTTLAGLFPNVAPSAMLHIGDNVRSDVRAARAAGLHAVHYDVIRHDPDATLALEQLVWGDRLPELASLRRLAGSLDGNVPATDRAWHRTGAQVVGPFLAALVDWALDQCVAEGITLIAPLMREGHLLAPLLRRAAEARGLAITVAPLYVSRHAVALAGIRDTKQELVTRLFEGRRQFTVADLFALIGAAVPSEIETYCGTLTTSADAVQVRPGTSLRAWIVAYLTSDPVQRDLQRLVRSDRDRLVSYLDDVFQTHTSVATLDIGFFGQIQRSIASALSLEGRDVRLTHLLGFGHGPIKDDVISGIDVRTFAGGYGADGELVRTIHRSAPVIEQLLQGPEGTTTGYATGTRRTTPISETNPLPANDIARKAVVQQGVRTFHELWLAFQRTNPTATSSLVTRRDAWCRLLHRLIAVPSHGEAARLGSLHDDVNFGSRAILPFCPTSAEAHVAWTGAETADQRGSSSLPVVWPQGVITRVDPGAIVTRHANAAGTPYVALAHTLVRQLRARGIRCVVGYGTGDVAAAFIDAARILGVDVAALVDSDPKCHGLDVRGIAVCSLDAAVALDIHVYAVLSVAHIAPITETIRRRYRPEPVLPLILDFANTIPTR